MSLKSTLNLQYSRMRENRLSGSNQGLVSVTNTFYLEVVDEIYLVKLDYPVLLRVLCEDAYEVQLAAAPDYLLLLGNIQFYDWFLPGRSVLFPN